MIGWWGWQASRLAIPVDPNAPDAEAWLRDELAKAPYTAAAPTWFDRLSQAVLDWLGSLSFDGDGAGSWLPVLGALVVIAALVAAVLIFGTPTRNRRRRQAGELFAAEDRRTADQIRRAAQAAAAAGDFTLASEESFRAIAQGLAERTIVPLLPGTTAHTVAVRAAGAFPGHRERLLQGAAAFERVRYLGGSGTEADYRELLALDTDLRAARPLQTEPAPVIS